MDNNELKQALSKFKDMTVLVLGDIMLDQYTFGEVARISPEAPVPIVKKTGERFVLGGAGNVANTVGALGVKVILAGVVGDDSRKDVIRSLCASTGIETRPIVIDSSRPTILKHRIVAGSNHQLLRFDDEDARPLDIAIEDAVLARVLPYVTTVNAIIFSDYTKGFFSKRMVDEILSAAKRCNIPVYADVKPKNKNLFVGVDLVTPNVKEAEEMSGASTITEMGQWLVRHFKSEVLLTRGGDGMSAFDRDGREFHVPARRISVFDVSGAGDTVVAVFALAKTAGLDLASATMCANAAGAVVVQKPGTATLSLEELSSALRETSHFEEAYTVPKIWGYEKWMENNDKYCSKILSLNKGYQCSLHYHKEKDETFLIKSGHVRLEMGDEVIHMREGNFVRIPPGTKHRFTGIEDSMILEISTHHDEADSYRLEESKKVQ